MGRALGPPPRPLCVRQGGGALLVGETVYLELASSSPRPCRALGLPPFAPRCLRAGAPVGLLGSTSRLARGVLTTGHGTAEVTSGLTESGKLAKLPRMIID